MTGWLSKKKMAANEQYGPISRKATWQDFLLSWERAAITRYMFSGDAADASRDIISDCMDQMQVLFPGKYTIVWHSPAPNEHHLTVHFDDPKQEMMWRIKYEG